jgi:hypothetical protein
VPEQQEQSPVIDLSFLDRSLDEVDEEDWSGPLSPEQVAVLLDEAARAGRADDVTRVLRVQVRLAFAVQNAGGPQAAQREAALYRLFTDRYREGAAPGLVAELCRLMGAGQ